MTVSERINRRDRLFDLLVENPEGVKVDDIKRELVCSHTAANQAIRDLRLFLGSSEPINVPCVPNGRGERWTYSLVGHPDGSREWVANRVGDTESRLRTEQAVIASMVTATDGRKPEGRRARLMERGLRHLIENLDALMDDATP